MYSKYTDDNLVAVIIHETWGCGWYTSHGQEDMLFCPDLAQAIETQDWLTAAQVIQQELRIPFFSSDFVSQSIIPQKVQDYAKELAIEWIPRGEKFIVHEYDGWETVWLKRNMKWIQA